MQKVDPQQQPVPTPLARDVGVELTLGLGPEDAVLRLDQGAHRTDLQPWLLDAVAVKIDCLGHHDEVPRPWDWENVLSLLEPGEELLYVLDHRAAESATKPGAFDLWLAIRFPPRSDIDSGQLQLREKRARVLISQLHRQAFPGSEVSWMDPGELLQRLGAQMGLEDRCVVVTGMPSPRSLNDSDRDVDRGAATRNFQSLNDVVEALFDLGCDYRIAFVVQRVSSAELGIELAKKTALYDRVHPLVERSVREGQNWASQWSENKSFAEAVGESSGQQKGTNKGTNLNFGGVGTAVGGLVGFALGGPPGALAGAAALGAIGGMFSVSKGSNEGSSTGRSWTHTKTTGSTSGGSQGASLDATATHVSSLLRLADRSLERTIDAMHEATGTGAYRWGAFAFADGQNVNIVGRSLMGVLAGSRTKDHPLVRFEVDGAREALLGSRTPTMELVAEAAPVLALPRVCDALLVPEAELPGLRLRRNVFLGRNVEAKADKDGLIDLGPDAFSAINTEATPASIKVPGGDLFKHILVAGTTGSGKTTRVVEILNRLDNPDLSVVVFETAKRTYRARLQRQGRPAPLVYSLGSSATHPSASRFRPLRMNPLYFELGTSLKRHIAVLGDALAELMPTESMLPSLLRRAVENCYTERGWDIEGGRPVSDLAPAWPTVIDLVAHVRRIADELTYGAEVNANYRGALESRAGLFLDATFQDIFGYDGDTPIDQLIPPGIDAIIEVEDLPPSDVDIRAFVMTLLLSRLRSVQGSRKVASLSETSLNDSVPVVHVEEPAPLGAIIRRHYSDGRAYPGAEALRVIRDGAVMRDDVPLTDPASMIIAPASLNVAGAKIRVERRIVSHDDARDRQVVDAPRQWLVVVEEAHNVLDRLFEQRRPSDEANAGRTLLRAVVRLLQEGREMGIGMMVIDQAPTKLARDVIGNTGIKVVLRLEDADEMAEVGRAMGLEEDAWHKLGYLQVGEALIKTSYMDRPAKSAGFRRADLSQGPQPVRPDGEGWSPSFLRLADLWQPLTRGIGAEPQTAWVEQVKAASNGNLRLAVFAGLRTLLYEGRAGGGRGDAPSLRALLAAPAHTDDALLRCARELWSGLVAAHYADQLANVAAAICAALVPTAAWRRAPITSDGVTFAAHALANAGHGAEEDWLWALGQVRPRGVSSRALAALANVVTAPERPDRTAALRTLMALQPAVSKWRGVGAPPKPPALVADIARTLAATLLNDDDPAGPVQRSEADALVADLEVALTRQVASRWGAAYGRQVEEFQSRAARFR
jgi:hypothetical protein